jgi:chromosome segregation ATPase
MSKADKRKIEELRGELRDAWDTITFGQQKEIGLTKEIDKLQEELHQQKEKYALLFERYISMMERTVRLNEQREADL